MLQITHFFQDYKKTQWFIFAIACLIYLNTIPNKWAVDDGIIIHQNSFVKKGISGLADIFTNDAFSGFYGKDLNMVSGGRYRPLTPALFAIEAEIFASPEKNVHQEIVKDEEGYKIKALGKDTLFPNILHLFNLLFYGVLCLVLYRTILLMMQTRSNKNHYKINFIAIITTLLYAVHPIHTEVVANVKGLDEILTLTGSLLSLYCVLKLYQISKENKELKLKWLIGSVLFYFLALLSKESAVTFIVVIPLSIWFFSQASIKTVLKLTLPLIITLIVFLGIRTSVLYHPNKAAIAEELMNDPFLVLDEDAKYEPLIEGSTIEKILNANENTFTQMPFSNKMATNFHTYAIYLKLLIAPYPLTIDYYPRHIQVKSFLDIGVLISVLINLFLLIWSLLNLRKKNMIAFGILFYFITFSIVSNFFFPIGTNMAERFMFIPSVGFCFVIACLLYALDHKLNKAKSKNIFSIVNSGIALILLTFSLLTIDRNFDWKDNYTLFSNDALVSVNSGKVQRELAGEYIEKAISIEGERFKAISNLSANQKRQEMILAEQEKKRLLEAAVPLLNKSLKIHPISSITWLQMATTQHNLGQLKSNDPNLSLSYLTTAKAAYSQVDLYKSASIAKVIDHYKSVCFMDLGKLYGEKFGQITEAIIYLEKAKELNPKEPEIYLLLGTAYSMVNDYEKTIEYTKKSLDLRPYDRDTKQNLAIAYQQYAYADTSKGDFLFKAEKLLLEVYNEEKKLPANELNKQESILRTLDLLYKNYSIQENIEKQNELKVEILKYNSQAFPN